MKLVVLIDADNISPFYADDVFTIVERHGEAITRRAFGNVTVFTGTAGWKDAVRKYAIEARPQVSNIDRKNTADFALIIDAMDCLASGRYDGFVLVTSDSDFTSLAQRLRNEDKAVYGIGDNRACISFRKACTEFFELKEMTQGNDASELSSPIKAAPAQSPEQLQGVVQSQLQSHLPNSLAPAQSPKSTVVQKAPVAKPKVTLSPQEALLLAFKKTCGNNDYCSKLSMGQQLYSLRDYVPIAKSITKGLLNKFLKLDGCGSLFEERSKGPFGVIFLSNEGKKAMLQFKIKDIVLPKTE